MSSSADRKPGRKVDQETSQGTASSSLGPWLVACLCGAVTTWLLWPDLHSATAHDSPLGLLMVVLSFVLGGASLALLHATAVLAGLATALVSYLLIRWAAR